MRNPFKKLLPYLPFLLVFHPRGPFKSWGPYIGVALLIIALPFLFSPTSRERVTDLIDPAPSVASQNDPSTTQPQTSPNPTGNIPPATFDPLRLTGLWALSEADADRATQPWSAARRAAADIWEAQRGPGMYSSFYCGCTITRTGSSSGDVDLASCAYESPGNLNRARRLEWEHVMPASKIGEGRTCWASGHPQCVSTAGEPFKGRECCELVDPIYQMMSNDPVNLVPAIGEINAVRSNLPFGLTTSGQTFGQCSMVINTEENVAMPEPQRRGDIARIYAYMSRAYGIVVSEEEAALFRQWMIEDPISEEEIVINRAIERTGQRPNPFVLNPEAFTPQP